MKNKYICKGNYMFKCWKCISTYKLKFRNFKVDA